MIWTALDSNGSALTPMIVHTRSIVGLTVAGSWPGSSHSPDPLHQDSRGFAPQIKACQSLSGLQRACL